MAGMFDNGTLKTIKFSGFSNSDFTSQSETAYIKPPHLTETPTSEKVRIESTQIGRLDPDAYNAKSSYDEYGLDSNRIEILFSPDDFIFEKISNYFGTFDIDDYIGDPREEFKPRYTTLDDFLRNSWQRYLIRFNINDFLRLFLLYDRGLFIQMERLLPARADALTGFSLGSTDALHRNKLERKPTVAKKPSYSGEIKKGVEEYFEIDPKKAKGLIDYRPTEKFEAAKQQKLEGTIIQPYNNVNGVKSEQISGQVDVIDSEDTLVTNTNRTVRIQSSTTFYSDSYQDSIWNGVRISSPGVNLPSNETFDGSPVVQRVVIRDSGVKVSG